MIDLTDEQLVLRAKEATRLMEDPLLMEAFEHLEENYVDAWKTTEDPIERDSLWMKTRVLTDLIVDLQMMIEKGQWVTEQNK